MLTLEGLRQAVRRYVDHGFSHLAWAAARIIVHLSVGHGPFEL